MKLLRRKKKETPPPERSWFWATKPDLISRINLLQEQLDKANAKNR